MNAEHDGYICVVCGRVLWEDTSSGRLVLSHPDVDDALDHFPVAVLRRNAHEQARDRCDFCLGEPVTHGLIADREVLLGTLVRFSKDWAMCTPCFELVSADDWPGLKRRVFAANPRLADAQKVDWRVCLRDLHRATVMLYIDAPDVQVAGE